MPLRPALDDTRLEIPEGSGEVLLAPPHEGPFLERRGETLREAPDAPYEVEGAPSENDWRDFLGRVERHLRSVREESIRERWARVRDRPMPRLQSLPAFLTRLRRGQG